MICRLNGENAHVMMIILVTFVCSACASYKNEVKRKKGLIANERRVVEPSSSSINKRPSDKRLMRQN